MAAFQPAPDARSQPGKAAGLAAVVLGTLVAVAIAALFLVLIGASRTGRLAPPEHPRRRQPPTDPQPGDPMPVARRTRARLSPGHDAPTKPASRS